MGQPEANPMRHRPRDDAVPPPRAHPSHTEGSLTRVIEQQTARIPSAVFLGAALVSLAASAVLALADKPRSSRFVELWAPTFMIAGVYNKLVKTLGTS